MLKAIIFDMDGVLINSINAIWESFAKAFEKYGVAMEKSDKKKFLGRSLKDYLIYARKKYSIKENIVVKDFSEECLIYQLKYLEDQLKPNDDINNIIKDAKSKGIKIAVATSSKKQRAIKILELLELLNILDTLVTGDDIENSKPNPEIFLKTAKLMEIAPEDCLVIEDDAINGISAAQAAHMKTAGKIGDHSKEELKMADLTFTDFKDITLLELEQVWK